MSDTDIRFAKLVQIIERMAKVIEKEIPETQLMAAMGLLLTVANSHDEERLVPVFKSVLRRPSLRQSQRDRTRRSHELIKAALPCQCAIRK